MASSAYSQPPVGARSASANFNTHLLTIDQRSQIISPDFEPLSSEVRWRDPSIAQNQDKASDRQRRFLQAAQTPCAPSHSRKYQRWQQILDVKAALHARADYSQRSVNVRLTLLFHIALNHRVGGPRYYPLAAGADAGNGGNYGNEEHLKFEHRLLGIETWLRVNKRIVMDVVEGRDVVVLCCRPGCGIS